MTVSPGLLVLFQELVEVNVIIPATGRSTEGF
jgi:hypothetical protein